MTTEAVLKNWPKEAGTKPAKSTLDAVLKNNLARPETKVAVAVAMALRPQGTTQSQVKAVLGQPHRNKLDRLVKQGTVKRVSMPKMDGVTVYKLQLKNKS